jgi:hypothetical protein
MKPLVALASAALVAWLATACAPRRQLCAGPAGCSAASECVAGQCLAKNANFPYAGTRRLVLPPADVAYLDGTGPPHGALPPIFTLGRADGGTSRLLLRFDFRLDAGTTLVRASVLLDRSDATVAGLAPVALHAERVIGRWNPRTVSRSTAPPVEDVRLPRTLVTSSGPTLVRVDVTDLARRWLHHDPADQGLVIVAENVTPTGVTFSLGADASPLELDPSAPPQPPRLEVYAR